MVKINDTLVSLDLLDEQFICDISACKGACCVQGDAGAPLLEEEARLMERDFHLISVYLQPEGKKTIDQQGVFVIDAEDEMVTPLIAGKECAFTIFDDEGIARCGIEMAWEAGKTSFRKPVSCHLYPVRVKRLKEYVALNYDRWAICKAAGILGKKNKMPVFRFVKEALIRRFGQAWYNELEQVASHYASKKP